MKKAEQTTARNILPRLPQGAGSNLKSYSPTQLHFLMRLSHLQRQRRDLVHRPGQRGAVELNALAGIDDGLAMQRRVVTIFRDEHMRDQAWTRPPSLDR